MLSVRQLAVRYARGATALEDVNFDIGEGSIVAMVGHSGSGKSTTAKAILGLLPKSTEVRGDVRFRGRQLLGQSEREWQQLRGRSIAMIWQEPLSALNPVLKIGTQLDEVARAHHPEWTKARRQEEIARAFVRVQLDCRLAASYAHEVSGGEAQRATIALALMGGPALLLADEPAAALDASTRTAILQLLLSLRRDSGISILYITHDEPSLAGFADDVIRIERGRICC